ncbi:hypothetical protein [Microcoleus sp.]|uniref:hypothetical protein n=1 Tax=Microcoleus sp. TaxID=44472 RepID=UPI003C766570
MELILTVNSQQSTVNLLFRRYRKRYYSSLVRSPAKAYNYRSIRTLQIVETGFLGVLIDRRLLAKVVFSDVALSKVLYQIRVLEILYEPVGAGRLCFCRRGFNRRFTAFFYSMVVVEILQFGRSAL